MGWGPLPRGYQKDGNQRKYYMLWPIRFGWLWRPMGHDTRWRDLLTWGWHGWQVDGAYDIAVFGQTLTIGPLKVSCGPGDAELRRIHEDRQKDAERQTSLLRPAYIPDPAKVLDHTKPIPYYGPASLRD